MRFVGYLFRLLTRPVLVPWARVKVLDEEERRRELARYKIETDNALEAIKQELLLRRDTGV